MCVVVQEWLVDAVVSDDYDTLALRALRRPQPHANVVFGDRPRRHPDRWGGTTVPLRSSAR